MDNLSDEEGTSLLKYSIALKTQDRWSHVQFVTKGCEHAAAAVDLDKKGNFEGAATLYMDAIMQLMKGLKFEKQVPAQNNIKAAVEGLMTRAETIKQHLRKMTNEAPRLENTSIPASLVPSTRVLSALPSSGAPAKSRDSKKAGSVRAEAVVFQLFACNGCREQ